MAELTVENNELILKLTNLEKAEAVHGNLHVPLSKIQNITIIHDAVEMTRIRTGFKVGMRAPGYASVATVRRPGYKAFIVVHHDTPQAIRVSLQGDSYDEWIVGATDPTAVIASLKLNES